ncbi:MAG: TolC family protein [Planctomycetaceae bacterium]
MMNRWKHFAAGSVLLCSMTGCGTGRGLMARFVPQGNVEQSESQSLAMNDSLSTSELRRAELDSINRGLSQGAVRLPSSGLHRRVDEASSESNRELFDVRQVAFDDDVPLEKGVVPIPPADEIRLAPVAEPLDGEVVGVVSAGWTLAQLESLALAQHPAIQEASASAHKVAGYHDQVGTRPNPVVGYNATQLADAGTDQHVAFVEQELVMGGKLALNQNVLSQEMQSQLWEVETQRYRVLTDVRQKFYEALAAQRRWEMATEFREIAAKGAEIAQLRVDAKEGSMTEVLQAEILRQQVEIQRQQAEAAYRGAWKQLMAATGQPASNPESLDGVLPGASEVPQWESVTSNVLASSPELQGARSRVSRARANIERQDVQAIPNVAVMLAAGRDNGTGSNMVNAQFGLPLPIFNRNEGNISAANAELCRASQEVRRLELAIQSRIAEAAQNYESALAAVTQYDQEILPRAERTLKLTEEAYAAGEFDFLQVLIVRRTYFEANLDAITAKTQLARAGAYLDGMVLSGGLDTASDTQFDSGLRDQSLSGQ